MFKGKLKEISGGKILDVGTGRGDMVHVLMESFKSYTEIIGIDTSDMAIELAKKSFGEDNIRFIKMEAGKMEFEDNSFDTVCISNTLHHLKEVEMYIVLNEMKRVLKSNGLFIICEMYSDNQNETQMGHVSIHHFSAEMDRAQGRVHNDTFKRSEIFNIASELGLEILDAIDYVDEGVSSKEEIEETIDHFAKEIQLLRDNTEYERVLGKFEEVKSGLLSRGLSGATELVLMGKNQ
jgi:ubiquinone/menaquinone biosynthesis C-methylase UbiE